MSADAPATHRDRQRLVLRLAELGIPTTDTDRQRHVCAVWTKGRAHKRSELTQRDARSLWSRLQTMTREELAAVEAMPVPHTSPAVEDATARLAAALQAGIELDAATTPAVDPAACLATWDEPPGEPEQDGALRAELAELPNGVITCRGGKPSAADVATVTAFAAELAKRGPAPSRGELRVAGWVGIPGKFVPLPGSPTENEEEHVPEPDPAPTDPVAPAVPLVAPLPVAPDPPADTVGEPGPADTADAQRPGPRDGDDRATVADHGPAVPAPVTVEPPPEDVEAAAEAAVERFRARQAAGIVPEAPPTTGRPPRAVRPYVAPGRYCLTKCYCGACPQYAEQKAEADRLYAVEVRRATTDPDDMPRRRR